jgi:hypothetical protein
MNKQLLFILPITALLFSCSNLIDGVVKDIDLPAHDPQIAASLFVDSKDSGFAAIISKTQGIYDTSSTGLLDSATLKLFKDGTLLYSWDNMSPFGTYDYDFGQQIGTIDGDIVFEISHPDHETVSATQRFPEAANFEVELNYGDAIYYGQPSDEIILTLKDNPGIDQHYLIEMSIHYRTSLTGQDTSMYFPLSPETTNSSVSYIGFKRPMVSEEGIDRDIKISFATGMNSIDQAFLLEYRVSISALSDDLYAFYKSYEALDQGRNNPFAEPVILFSNMSNSIGSFGLSTTTRKWK